MEHFLSITNPSTISSAILLALVPSVSTLLPLIGDSLTTWLNVTIIMHQAMLLTVQAMLLTVQACIFPSCICPKLICHSSPCVSARDHQLFYRFFLATWNWVFWLLSQVEDLFQPLILVIRWPKPLSIFWWYSVHYIAATGRCWLSQVSDSGPDVSGTNWFTTFYCFRHSGDCPSIVPHRIRMYFHQKLWWTDSCCISSGMFQVRLPTMDLSTHTASLSIIWRKQRSSGRMFLSLVRVMPQRFFTSSPAKIHWGGILGFINLGMEKSRLYGIGSLMWTSGISISSKLLTMQRQ